MQPITILTLIIGIIGGIAGIVQVFEYFEQRRGRVKTIAPPPKLVASPPDTQRERIALKEGASSGSDFEALRLVKMGSEGVIKAGFGITKSNHGSTPEVWTRSDTTLILGCNPLGSHLEIKASSAEWTFNVNKFILANSESAVFIVCCERVHGGLHSPRFGGKATIYVNGKEIEEINLVVMPDNYTDYHHREQHFEYSAIWPMNICNSIYRFAIPTAFLKGKRKIVARIRLDPQVRWDIDYVVVLISYRPNID